MNTSLPPDGMIHTLFQESPQPSLTTKSTSMEYVRKYALAVAVILGAGTASTLLYKDKNPLTTSGKGSISNKELHTKAGPKPGVASLKKKSPLIDCAVAPSNHSDISFAELLRTNGNTPMQLHKGSILGRILFGKNVNDDAVVIRTGTTKFCVNWSENLQYMWQEKLKRYPNNKAVNDFYNEVVLKWKPEYKNRNFDAFYTTNNDIIHDMHGQINWQNIEQELSPSKTKILRMILGEMNFDSILAYGLTELFEERPGAVNLEAFKAIYNSAGIEYINLIPAQFDKYLSFGLWQFTSLAVGPESGVSKAQKKYFQHSSRPIPISMKNFKSGDHVRAAYMFSVYNLIAGLKRLTPKEERNLEKIWKKNPENTLNSITQFIASAHNRPTNAYKALRAWTFEEGRHDFRNYVQANRSYPRKAQKHFEAIGEADVGNKRTIG